MDPRDKLRKYIKDAGGVTAAAPVIGCAKITLWKALSGSNGIGKSVAEKLEEASGGQLKFGDMMRIKPTIKQATRKRATKKAAKRKPRARGRK